MDITSLDFSNVNIFAFFEVVSINNHPIRHRSLDRPRALLRSEQEDWYGLRLFEDAILPCWKTTLEHKRIILHASGEGVAQVIHAEVNFF